MASAGQFDSDESDEVFARGDKKTAQKKKVKNLKQYNAGPINTREAANEWSTGTASNDGESNASPRTGTLMADESSSNTFRYDLDQNPTSSAAVPKDKSGKKKKSHKMDEEKPMTDDGSHMVDTFSDTTETKPFDSFNKEPPAAENTSKFKSIFRRESFKNMGKVLSGKMHSSNLETQEENEEPKQDQQNKNQSHTNPMNWMKDRFRKQNKDANSEPQPRSVLHDVEMEQINLDSTDEGGTDGNNLLTANPATMAFQPRPTSHNNSYGQTRSVLVDVDDNGFAQMNEKGRKIYRSKMCMSVALAIILVGGIILGIILWAMSSFGLAFKILGPTIFGLSLFALVYKMFLTFIWKEDPYEYLESHFKHLDKAKSLK